MSLIIIIAFSSPTRKNSSASVSEAKADEPKGENEEGEKSPKLTLIHGMSLESTGLDIRDEGNLESISNWSTVPDEEETNKEEHLEGVEEKDNDGPEKGTAPEENPEETPADNTSPEVTQVKPENEDDLNKNDMETVIATEKITDDLVEILSQKSFKDDEHTYALEA